MPAPPGGLSVQFRWRGKTYRSAFKGLSLFADSLGDDVERLTPVVRQQLDLFMRGIIQAMRQRHSTPWPEGTSPKGVKPGTMSRRSSGIASSLGYSVSGSALNEVRAAVFGSKITKVHERGAVIRAKRARYLTIPLPAAMDSRGNPLKRRARDWQNTFVKRSKKGALIIFQSRGRGEIIPLYVLKKQVRIPARLGLADTVGTAVPLFEQEVIGAMLDELQREAGL